MGIIKPDIVLAAAAVQPPPPLKPTRPWQDIVAEKLAEREAAIPPAWRLPTTPEETYVLDIPRTCGILTPREIEITEQTAAQLLPQLASRSLSSEEVTTAFCKRAAIAQQLTNCLSEIFFEQGIAAARAIDEEYARTGVLRGPLHGLPVSLKDQVNLPGKDATIGFVALAHRPAALEADLATTLREAGAVFYCKTNVPTGMLMGETYNNIYGYTSNPYSTTMSAGGSSGGEGALLALRGSPLGVGSDIGGSIRVPAGANGLWGLKPAGGRLSGMGCAGGLPGQESIKATTGPMAVDARGLEIYAKVILDGKPWERDPTCFALPWREVTLPHKLAFGMILDDGLCRPTPAVRRTLLETKAALEAAGHTVVEWAPPDPERALQIAQRLFTADGGAALSAAIAASGEPWPEGIKEFGEIHAAIPTPTVTQLWKAQADRTAYLVDLWAAWASSKDKTGTGRAFDGLIAPVMPYPTCPWYGYIYILYTTLWNLADMSSCAFPAGFVKAGDGAEEERNGMEWRCDDERNIWGEYNADKLLLGCPIGLQVVTRRHQDEESIKLASVAFQALAAYRASLGKDGQNGHV